MESRSVMGVEIILMDLRKEKLSPDLLSLRASFLIPPSLSLRLGPVARHYLES